MVPSLGRRRDYPVTMVGFETVRVAAVQATPVILDVEATIDKTVELLGEAADRDARLVVFPEIFVSLYPSGAWASQASTWASGLRRVVGADVGVERRRRWTDGRSPGEGLCRARRLSRHRRQRTRRQPGRARCTTRCW